MVAQHDVPIYLTGVGTVIAFNTDVVRAQIQGQIISIDFKEGQHVHAGDLLAQIDPRPYQAQIEQFTDAGTFLDPIGLRARLRCSARLHQTARVTVAHQEAR